MAFTTINFAYFFVLTTTVSWSLRRYRTYQKVFLLLASYYFYARWDLKLSALLAGASLFDWAISRALGRVTHPGHRKAVLVAAVGANVALLGVFKLYDFFRASVASFGDFVGLSAHLPVLETILSEKLRARISLAVEHVARHVDVAKALVGSAKELDQDIGFAHAAPNDTPNGARLNRDEDDFGFAQFLVHALHEILKLRQYVLRTSTGRDVILPRIKDDEFGPVGEHGPFDVQPCVRQGASR